MAVTDIGLAVNDRRKTATGEWVDETTFVDVTLWGRTAETAGEYLTKGSPVLIEGRLKLDAWETSDGQKRSKLKVVCDRMQMLGGRGGQGAGGGGPPAERTAAPRAAQPQSAPPDEGFEPPRGEPAAAGGDDIPF